MPGRLAAAIANAEAYEEERRRAEALAELDRAKTTFFTNVSHEFRTPLTLMLGPLEDALRDPRARCRRERERLELVHRNALRLLKLVNTLLDFSRIEAGRVQATFEPTDLAALTARACVEHFRSAIERAGLSSSSTAPPLDEPVYVDRDMWEKIVLNLLSNAFKFTFDGEIAVALRDGGRGASSSVERHRRRHPGGRAAARVRALSSRRRRAAARTKAPASGSRWCMSSSSSTAAGRSTSEVGRGTTFTVTLRSATATCAGRRRAALTARHAGVSARARSSRRRCAGSAAGVSRRRRRSRDDAASRESRGHEAPASAARSSLADDNADMRDYVARLLARSTGRSRRVADGRRRSPARPATRPRPDRRDDAGARRLRAAARAARRSG